MKKLTLLLLTVCLLTSFKAKELTWVAIGDSITYLNDHKDETQNRLTRGYLTQVTEKLPNIHYINKGYNGWTSGGIADSFDKLNIPKGDIYTIFLGTNDWWQGRPIGTIDDYKNNAGNNTIYGSFRIILDKIKALNPDAKIILMTPLQRVDFVYLFDKNNNAHGSYRDNKGQTLEAVANAIASIGKLENIPVDDLYHDSDFTLDKLVKFKRVKDQSGQYADLPYPKFIDVPFNPATDDYPYPKEAIDLTYDGLHPSDKGCAIIAKSVVKIMKKF
ncbi:SGNH/GDSL hydrolase family protein [Mucilaginibacter corticis]|uniref:SGNH/GDSL hydrolase family protein n=1 Tax=Mucilaginibacter corticis TaxID=2597670 RepID=A0A556MX08_9SPHI|nr:SGNH/GDSL hydrolase family protein [Mucilaginibacter corticis]TSJ44348.1 SGNH/GDSL hydrolase family protein [Mucilaginibacter corticis]